MMKIENNKMEEVHREKGEIISERGIEIQDSESESAQSAPQSLQEKRNFVANVPAKYAHGI